MGSHSSKQLRKFQEDFQSQATPIKELALVNFEEFLDKIKELNSISRTLIDDKDKQLVFSVQKGSDATIFWKKTVKIACIKVDKPSGHIDSAKLLSLAQVMHIHRLMAYHLGSSFSAPDASSSTEEGGATCDPSHDKNKTVPKSVEAGEDESCCSVKQDFTASMIFNSFGQEDDSSLIECCICMERRPEVILPCAHNYCLPCIEQWNVCHKTCPLCREALKNTDETWVLYEVPDSAEVASELGKTLMKLADT